MILVKRLAVAAAVLVALAAASVPAWAGEAEGEIDFMAPFEDGLTEKIAKANEGCFGCHSEEGLKKPPQPDLDLAKLATMLVNPGHYGKSAHTGMDCRDCHGRPYAAYPHPRPLAMAKPCIECHARRVATVKAEFEASVHYKQFPNKFSCQTCHDAHVYSSARRIGKPRDIVRQDNAACIDCHGSAERYLAVAGFDKPFVNFRVAHTWLPYKEFHWVGVRCIDCHTSIPSESVSHELFPKDRTSKECVNCHTLNSALSNRLYRHLVDDKTLSGLFTNAAILPESYVVGATRSIWMDRIAMVLVSLALGTVVIHGFLRWILGVIRRARSKA